MVNEMCIPSPDDGTLAVDCILTWRWQLSRPFDTGIRTGRATDVQLQGGGTGRVAGQARDRVSGEHGGEDGLIEIERA